MLNLIKVIVMLAIASFSLNVSAYVYKDKGSSRDYGVRYTHSMDFKKVGHKKKWSFNKRSFNKWDTGSIDCGVLCKDDDYKSKASKRHNTKNIYVALKKLKTKLKRKVAYEGNSPHDDKLPRDDKPPQDNDVPEPGIVGLLAIGLLGMIVARRKIRA